MSFLSPVTNTPFSPKKNEAYMVQHSFSKKTIHINTLVYERNNKLIVKRTIRFKSNSEDKRIVDISTFEADFETTDIEFTTTNPIPCYE